MSDSNLYGQDTDLAVILCFKPHLRSGFFIDIGAEKGSFAAGLVAAGMEGVCFEPLPSHLVALKERFQGQPVKIFPNAVDETDREAAFHVATGQDGKELDYYHSLNPLGSHDYFAHTKEIPVSCRSLQSLVKSGELPGECGVLKVDTEGNDLNVLKGLGELRPEVIVCEFVPPSVYPGWELAFASRLVPYAAELGYSNFLAICRTHGVEGEQLLLNADSLGENDWGNLVFFRQDCFDAVREGLAAFITDHGKKVADAAALKAREEAAAKEADERKAKAGSAPAPQVPAAAGQPAPKKSLWQKLFGGNS